jgi:hypothetical protein
MITAHKGTLKKQFTDRIWAALGSDKYGWAEMPTPPKEVVHLVEEQHQQEAVQTPKQSKKKRNAKNRNTQ